MYTLGIDVHKDESHVVVLDDTDEIHDEVRVAPGAVARVDHRYERNGKERIHLATEPLTGWVNVEITDR